MEPEDEAVEGAEEADTDGEVRPGAGAGGEWASWLRIASVPAAARSCPIARESPAFRPRVPSVVFR